jgi:MFS family permease
MNDAQQAIAYAGNTDAPLSPFRKWGSLVVLSLALAIIVIDTTLLNVSLKTIINDLHTNIESMQWVITAYSLVLAAFTITGGRLGDLFGRKKMFMLGAVIFAIGSFLASISENVGTMIAGEAIIEGIGAALMMPATASILVANFKGKERGIAFGIWGGIAAASSAIGPILGGWLTTNYSWLAGVSTYGLIIMPTYIDEGYVTYTSGHLVLSDEETDNSGETESDIKSIMLYQLAMDIYKAAKTVAKVVGLKLSKPEQPPKGTQFKPFLTNLCESYQTEIVNKCITP